MRVEKLSSITFEELLDCFLKAFENYYVQMPTDKHYYQERWKAAKVDYNFSYGMFDNGKLVGFIIHAIDKRNGILTAFNTGTGVLPDYRGKRIVHAIYKHAFSDLKQHGIRSIKLEVITKNTRAVRAYEGIGFEICKTFKCFNGKLQLQNNEAVQLKEINSHEVKWEALPNQEYYSWDNQKESLLNGDYKYFKVFNDKHDVDSFFIIKPESGYLAQIEVLNTENTDSWTRLFSAINQISTTIKINNVDARLVDKIYQLRAVGLDNKIDQYEMVLDF